MTLTKRQRARYAFLWVARWLSWSPGWWPLAFPAGLVIVTALTSVSEDTVRGGVLWFVITMVLGEILWRVFDRTDERRNWKIAEQVSQENPEADPISVMQIATWLDKMPQHRRYLVNLWVKREIAKGNSEIDVDVDDPETPPEVVTMWNTHIGIEGPWWSPGEST